MLLNKVIKENKHYIFGVTLINVKSNRGIEQIQIPKTMDFKGNFNRTQKVYKDFIISFTFKSLP